ncbi:MAG: hypothetical protein K2X03_15680 [Bryobacteraceae bacterium]|nr:hypothetical protein [Bryobacteraceae bacterium]
MTNYLDFDYDSIPPADLDLDLHWIQLPVAAWEAKQAARRRAAHPDHQIILVPSHPDYSPTEQELWPLVNQTVLACLEPHPELRLQISAAVSSAISRHRGWRNPYPVNPKAFEIPEQK